MISEIFLCETEIKNPSQKCVELEMNTCNTSESQTDLHHGDQEATQRIHIILLLEQIEFRVGLGNYDADTANHDNLLSLTSSGSEQ